MIAISLTDRQQEVVVLYYIEGLTEEQVAAVLSITQPTVSQHLTGRVRCGKRVGGAMKNLSKGIARLRRRGLLDDRENQILAALDEALIGVATRQKVGRLFASLRG